MITGMLIPRGSIIIPNIWAMVRDPNVYHEPGTFKPERYLESQSSSEEVNPVDFVFGFGRR
jgi:cytochrome P450